jgi:hypothetical protein
MVLIMGVTTRLKTDVWDSLSRYLAAPTERQASTFQTPFPLLVRRICGRSKGNPPALKPRCTVDSFRRGRLHSPA